MLDLIERDLLQPEIVERALTKAIQEARPSEEAAAAARARLQDELRKVEAKLGRLTTAIAEEGSLSALVVAVKERERQQARLQAEQEALDSLRQVTSLDLHRLRRELRALLPEWQGALRKHSQQARQIVRKLLGDRLIFTAKEGPDGRYYDVRGEGMVGRLLTGIVGAKGLVTPAGPATIGPHRNVLGSFRVA